MNNRLLKILIPSNNIPERQYIISVLLQDILGVKYHLEIDPEIDYTLFVWEDKNIIFQDYFWNNNKIDKSYIKIENIPSIIRFAKTEGILGLPIIYGNDFYSETNTTIECGIDIFASAFFLLTRWEEFILGRENTGKCNEFELLCVRNNCTKRAFVNEYLELLRSLFDKFGICCNAANFQKIMVTHDVDRCYLSSFADLLKNLLNLAFHDKQYLKAFISFKNYLTYKIKGQSPFNCFDELMDYSDSFGVINYFYFKACLYKESGYTYAVTDNIVRNSLNKIITRGHIVGIHPSENTFDNDSQFDTEYLRLQEVIGEYQISGGRNHGLYYNTNSLRQWNTKLQYDSGFGYQFFNGFRCGICYPYHMFDIINREKLDLYEIPFVAMDSVAIRNKWSALEMLNDAKETINIVQKYKGTICINWHSNLINAIERKEHKNVYFELIQYIASL